MLVALRRRRRLNLVRVELGLGRRSSGDILVYAGHGGE